MDDFWKQLGRDIANYRRSQNLRQYEYASHCHMRARQLGEIENGKYYGLIGSIGRIQQTRANELMIQHIRSLNTPYSEDLLHIYDMLSALEPGAMDQALHICEQLARSRISN